jgi:hypothetical protein
VVRQPEREADHLHLIVKVRSAWSKALLGTRTTVSLHALHLHLLIYIFSLMLNHAQRQFNEMGRAYSTHGGEEDCV